MRRCIALILLFSTFSDLEARDGAYDGLVEIKAEEVRAAQVLVSLSVIPAIKALHEWVPKASVHDDQMASFQQSLIAPQVVFDHSLGVLKHAEAYLNGDPAQMDKDMKSLQSDLKLLAAAQFYCLEMYSVFSDPKLPMADEEREQLIQSIKKASKVYLGVSDLLLGGYADSGRNNPSPVQNSKIAPSTPEYASISYQDATLLAAIARDSTTNSVAQINIQSSLNGVEPPDIDLFIDSKKGRIPLSVDPDGMCRVPLTEELINENPKIISNQPRKTLTMEIFLPMESKHSVTVENNRIRYNDLMRSVQEINNRIFDLERSGKFAPSSLPMIALLVQYTGIDLPAAIVIEVESGDVSMPVTPGKWCMLADRKSMRDENPWVRLPPYSFRSTAVTASKPVNWEEQ